MAPTIMNSTFGQFHIHSVRIVAYKCYKTNGDNNEMVPNIVSTVKYSLLVQIGEIYNFTCKKTCPAKSIKSIKSGIFHPFNFPSKHAIFYYTFELWSTALTLVVPIIPSHCFLFPLYSLNISIHLDFNFSKL